MSFTQANGNPFLKATRERINIRLALCGPTGSGKTYTALGVASTIAKKMGSRVAVIDTENRSADRYADVFDFDRVVLSQFAPESYEQMIHAAASAKYGVLVIDSFSHAWDGPDGMLERVDQIAAQSRSGNTFQAWGKATPVFRALIQTLLNFPGHLIVTMRTKMEYVLEDDAHGKKIPKKVGMAPIMRAGVEYEFDVCADMDLDHTMVITKSRCFALANKVMSKPGPAFAESLFTWANQGEVPAPPKIVYTTPAATTSSTPADTPNAATCASGEPAPAPHAIPSEPPADPQADLEKMRKKRCIVEYTKFFHGDTKAALDHAAKLLKRPLGNSRSITADEAQFLLDSVTTTYQDGAPAKTPEAATTTDMEKVVAPPVDPPAMTDANRDAMLDKIHLLSTNFGADMRDMASSILGREIIGPVFKSLSDEDLVIVLNRLQEINAQRESNAGLTTATTNPTTEKPAAKPPASAPVVEKITPTQVLMKINTLCREMGALSAEQMLDVVSKRIGRRIFRLTELSGDESQKIATDLEYCKTHAMSPTAVLDEISF